MTTLKISELIARLEEFRKEHGDLPVWAAEVFGGAYGEIDLEEIDCCVTIDEECVPFIGRREGKFPKRVSITLC